MIRVCALVLILTVSFSLAPATQAADWRDIAFPVQNHDFGTVAVAAKTEYVFEVNNTFSSPMHIRSIRASCGCTTPTILTEYIPAGQKGQIHARFNTDTFKGKKGATLTVIMDQPFYSEVRLRVDGYIRSDMVFHPGAVEFGQLQQGEPVTKKSTVYYAGREAWEIVDIQSNRPWLIPSFVATVREGGRVNYEINVTVREDAPTGFFQDELVVITNDRTMPRVPLRITGSVESPLSISPQAIAVGSLKPGQSVTRQLVLLGKKPFKVDSIKAEGWDITFPPTLDDRKMHVVQVKMTPTTLEGGALKTTMEIVTAGEESVSAKALLTGDLRIQ
ncbi:MAG: DUF1573 domain-containing protein [Rubripirellula sp.]